jgi:hypothetical protein
MVTIYSPNNFNRSESFTLSVAFSNTSSDQLRLFPFIRSVAMKGAGLGWYLNISSLKQTENTTLVSLELFKNYSYPVNVCITLLLVKEAYLKQKALTAYTSSGVLTLDSGSDGRRLESVAGGNFGISYVYGPVLQPKCLVGFRAFYIQSDKRQAINFDISSSTTLYGSSGNYLIDYSYLCLADIACPDPTNLYYPLLNDCEPPCGIPSCLACLTSTSCLNCSLGTFLNPLSRCSPCLPNCLSCLNSTSCVQCSPGLFFKEGVCQQCPLYCLNCSISLCTSCV